MMPLHRHRFVQESISPTFYVQICHTKVLNETLLYLDFRFVLFWRKSIGAKAARIMLVKLTPDFQDKKVVIIFALRSVTTTTVKDKNKKGVTSPTTLCRMYK
jgi:hypothetical protein